MPDFRIETERLTLRTTRDTDAEALLDYHKLPEVARYLLDGPWDAAVARAKVQERLPRTGLDSPARSLSLVVELEGRVIGDIAIWITDKDGKIAEIGWTIDPAVTGRGYATEAARAVIDSAFRDHGIHRIAAQMDARNTASARLAERLGMQREAHLRQDWWVKGEWTDTVIYALLE